MFEFCSLHVVQSGENAFSLCFCFLYLRDEYAHTSDVTITTAMCTVNREELKRRFWTYVTHTRLQGNEYVLHPDSSDLFHTWLETPINSACQCLEIRFIPFHAAVMLLSACHWRFSSLKVTEPHYVKAVQDWRICCVSSASRLWQ